MGINYYKTLEVDRSINGDDLKEAFHKLALKWHPETNPKNKKEAGDKFNQIFEAYSVLRDPQRRAVYDHQSGEHRLNSGGPAAFRSYTRSADDFSWWFGSGASTFQLGGSGDDFFAPFGNGGEGGSGNMSWKAAAIERSLPCSLENLYKGTSEKIKNPRTVTDPTTGKPIFVKEILDVEIKPGWKKGTKLTFPKKGNEVGGLTPADLVYIIEEKPHRVFKRDDNDLIVTQTISLMDALTGYEAQLTTLDGRNLSIGINSIITPSYEHVVRGEGMPLPEEPSKKGKLRIKFNIEFPSTLSSEQKIGLKKLLAFTMTENDQICTRSKSF